MTGGTHQFKRAWPGWITGSAALSSLILPVLLLAAGDAPAADADLLVSTNMQEFFDSKEQVSGSSTVGAVYIGEADRVREDALYAYINHPHSSELVLKINSIDGRYANVIHYQVDPAVSGWFQLQFNTQYKEFVRKHSTSEIAGLLTDGEGKVIYPLRWGSKAGSKTLRLYINSERARSYFYGGGKRATYCTTPSRSSGFKFNSVCDVPVDAIDKSGEINIHRKFGVRTVDPILVKLSLPPAP